jgi:hypothetical protein
MNTSTDAALQKVEVFGLDRFSLSFGDNVDWQTQKIRYSLLVTAGKRKRRVKLGFGGVLCTTDQRNAVTMTFQPL